MCTTYSAEKMRLSEYKGKAQQLQLEFDGSHIAGCFYPKVLLINDRMHL